MKAYGAYRLSVITFVSKVDQITRRKSDRLATAIAIDYPVGTAKCRFYRTSDAHLLVGHTRVLHAGTGTASEHALDAQTVGGLHLNDEGCK